MEIAFDEGRQRASLISESKKVPSSFSVSLSYLGSFETVLTYSDETYGVFRTNYSDYVEDKSDNYTITTPAQPFGCRLIFADIDEPVPKVSVTSLI